MEIRRLWTTYEEAEKLKKRLTGVDNKAQFARDFGISGGGAMIYQHENAIKPISLEAAVSYATGFRCSLADISPRWAAVVAKVTSQTDQIAKHETDIIEVVRLMRAMDESGRRSVLRMARATADDCEPAHRANGAQ